MTTKIGDLTQIGVDGPQDSDIFVLNDFSEGETKRVTFEQIKGNIIDPSTFTNNDPITESIIDAINGYSGASINAGRLGGELPAYYLEYTNLTNRLDVPEDDVTKLSLGTLLNDAGFVQYDTSSNPPRLVYAESQTDTLKPPSIPISTKNIIENPEGSVSGEGLYYTDQRVINLLSRDAGEVGSFANFFTQYTATFDETNIKDSLFEVEGTFTDLNVAGQEQASIIRVTDTSIRDNFAPNQRIRVYGGKQLAPQAISLNAEFTTEVIGLTRAPEDTTTPQTTVRYKIAEFEFNGATAGEISPTSIVNTTNHVAVISVPPEQAGDGKTVFECFNTTNFIKLNFTAGTTNYESRGILVYRKVDGLDTEYVLISVLGPKEITRGNFIDYYTFDYVTWSGKNPANNSYYFGDDSTFEMVHFPVTAHGTAESAARRGWDDVTIKSVSALDGSGYFDIELNETLYVNADSKCNIAHNDTATIQAAVTSNQLIGRKTITLNPKNYVSEIIQLPDEFGISGTPYITRVTKLPWSGFSVSNNNLIKHVSKNADASQISLIGFDIDGNNKYQVQFVGGTESSSNYIINYGIQPRQPFVDRVRILATPGGGIYASSAIDLRIVNSEVRNSSTSDFNVYKPLYATGSKNITVTSNTFENFSDNIDVSVTERGVFNGNIIANCGSGLLIYGSTFFISNPNVIVGPAGEFIPTPDTLNSVYDSINIKLDDSYQANSAFISTTYRYQENGSNYDLTASDGLAAGARVYDIKYLQKTPNGVEEFWTPTTADPFVINGSTSFVGDEDERDGLFAFTIPFASVADFKDAGGSNSYSSLVEENENHVGLIYTVSNVRENTVSGGITQIKNEATGDIYTSQTALDNAGNPNFATTDYTVRVSDVQRFLTVDSQVRLHNHSGFSVNGAGDTGVVTNINTTDGVSDVTIRYAGASSITPGNPTTGVINIINKFLLAQGRIF